MKRKLCCLAFISATAIPVAANAQSYTAVLSPLNGSNVNGIASLLLSGNFLTVQLDATGLEPNQVHLEHIHGLLDQSSLPIDSRIPTLAQDTDHDNFIELDEGATTYGPILLQLTSPPG